MGERRSPKVPPQSSNTDPYCSRVYCLRQARPGKVNFAFVEEVRREEREPRCPTSKKSILARPRRTNRGTNEARREATRTMSPSQKREKKLIEKQLATIAEVDEIAKWLTDAKRYCDRRNHLATAHGGVTTSRHRRLKYAGGTKSYRSLSPSHLTTFARSPEISRRFLPSFINSNARLKIGAAGTISPDHRVHSDPQAARDPSRAAGLCAPQGIRGVVRQLGGLAQSGKTATAAKGGAGRSASARRSIPTRSKPTATSAVSKRPSGSSRMPGPPGWSGPICRERQA